MSDRAYLALIVHDCAPDEASQILAVIADYGLHLEWDEPAPGDALGTRQQYIDNEAPLGTEHAIASALVAAAPQCSFTVWQAPMYESDGALVMHEPDLGRLGCGCDAYGAPHITVDVVDGALASCREQIADAAAGDLAAELHSRLGVPWRVAFDRCAPRTIRA